MEHTAPAVPGYRGLTGWPFVGATNYYVAMAIDLTAALAFLGLGIRRFVGLPIVAGGVVLLGFLSFGLLEYAVHRWVLHGPPSVARRGHRNHHAQPTALVATPFFVAAIASIAIWQLLRLLCPAGAAALFVFGLYAGYNHFALFHHWVHHHRSHVSRVSVLAPTGPTASSPSSPTERELRRQHNNLGLCLRHISVCPREQRSSCSSRLVDAAAATPTSRRKTV